VVLGVNVSPELLTVGEVLAYGSFTIDLNDLVETVFPTIGSR